MNTTENNKLIAEFEGHKINYGFKRDGVLFSGHHISVNKLKYHNDWNWLMGVVEKIENKLKIKIDISLHICRIYVNEDYTIVISENMGKIESVYTAVIKFIKWYNQQAGVN